MRCCQPPAFRRAALDLRLIGVGFGGISVAAGTSVVPIKTHRLVGLIQRLLR